MTTKLTLSVKNEVIVKAKSYAKANGKSLSQLVESYFNEITATKRQENEISTDLKSLIGVIKLPKDFDEKEALKNYLTAKHL